MARPRGWGDESRRLGSCLGRCAVVEGGRQGVGKDTWLQETGTRWGAALPCWVTGWNALTCRQVKPWSRSRDKWWQPLKTPGKAHNFKIGLLVNPNYLETHRDLRQRKKEKTGTLGQSPTHSHPPSHTLPGSAPLVLLSWGPHCTVMHS